MRAPTARPRVTVVGGFLGAGKSTWLQHHLARGALVGARAIVNEAAATPVDHLVLGGAGPITVLAGGCACCEAKADLMALLRRMLADGPRGDASPERIVIELSGLADPHPVAAAVRGDPVLAAGLDLGETVVLVGAPQGLDLLRHEGLARRQVAAADCVIVTGLDQAGDADVARLRGALQLLNPTVPVFGAVRGVEAPLPPAAEIAAHEFGVLLSDPDQAPLQVVRLPLGPSDWTAFALWLSALLEARGSDVVRVKGMVGTPAGRLLIQAVAGRVQAPEILPGPPAADDNTVVLIGRDITSNEIRRSFESFAAHCRSAD